MDVDDYEALVEISIPFWSDFNPRRFLSHNELFFISIPFWSDFNLRYEIMQNTIDIISIPFWSDFNLSFFSDSPDVSSFQSHFGLILTCVRCGDLIPPSRISIPFWSDFNAQKPPEWYCEVLISIPFWSDFNLRAPFPLSLPLSHFNPILV